jgi:hypothetical protein
MKNAVFWMWRRFVGTDAQYRISLEFHVTVYVILKSLVMVVHEPGYLIGQYS